jgi:hypothetical protein
MLDKIKDMGQSVVARASNKKTPTGTYIIAHDVGTEYVKSFICEHKFENNDVDGVGRAHQA